MNKIQTIPNDKEIYQLYLSITNQTIPFNGIKDIIYKPASELIIQNYTNEKNEIEEGKWINQNEHITINKRCNNHLWIIQHPTIKAISLAHYHTKGLIGKLTIFIN